MAILSRKSNYSYSELFIKRITLISLSLQVFTHFFMAIVSHLFWKIHQSEYKALPECLKDMWGVMLEVCKVTTWDLEFICVPGDLALPLCQQAGLDLSVHNILTAVVLLFWWVWLFIYNISNAFKKIFLHCIFFKGNLCSVAEIFFPNNYLLH